MSISDHVEIQWSRVSVGQCCSELFRVVQSWSECYSQASFESKLLRAMAKACRSDMGHDTSHENWEAETRPNCIDTNSLLMDSPNGWVVGMVGANDESVCLPISDWLVGEDNWMSSLSWHVTNWKFLTLAWVTRPLKFNTYDWVSANREREQLESGHNLAI